MLNREHEKKKEFIMDLKTCDFIEKFNKSAKVKIELQKAGVNFYKTDTLDILQARLAYARNHQKPLLKKFFVFLKGNS